MKADSNGQVSNRNVGSVELLPTPGEIKNEFPLNDRARQTVLEGRKSVEAILERRDQRIMLVVGPCSIHDLDSAREYAKRLKVLAEDVSDQFFVLMRVYFSKPRTTVGWKGFINDPDLDDSFDIHKGLSGARQFLLELGELGLAVGTEALDPIIPQFLDDLVTWNAIGARTAESQTHREMASGLSTPVGFKNGTDGNIQVAVNGITTMMRPHHFMGINEEGRCVILRTRGNPHGHIILRGGKRPNYDSVSLVLCERELESAGLPANIMIDCSHGNSLKDASLQPLVMRNCINQVCEGNRSIMGLMLESHLEEGLQKLAGKPSDLTFGLSITDACLGWEKTDALIRESAEKLRSVPNRE